MQGDGRGIDVGRDGECECASGRRRGWAGRVAWSEGWCAEEEGDVVAQGEEERFCGVGWDLL